MAQQLSAPHPDVLWVVAQAGWRILYVDSHTADEAYLFYHGDPGHGRYVALWSGAAAPHEEASIGMWAVSHAPGIPQGLAACFAWQATRQK